MAAIIEIHEMTATQTGLQRDGDKVRFYSADITATNSAGNPMVIPTVASDWSYTKQLRFYMGVTGPSNFVASLKVYCDGQLWGAANASQALVQYDRLSRASFVANIDTNISGVNIENATALDPASLCVLASTFNATNLYFGAIFRMQLEVGNGASPGTLSQETITFQQ
jgi:hypothetical protein